VNAAANAIYLALEQSRDREQQSAFEQAIRPRLEEPKAKRDTPG
jgi:hypothetical protein